MSMTTEQRVRDVLAQTSGRDTDTIKPESHLQNDLGMDSLDMHEVAILIEDEFDIYITDSELNGCITAGDVTAMVSKKWKD